MENFVEPKNNYQSTDHCKQVFLPSEAMSSAKTYCEATSMWSENNKPEMKINLNLTMSHIFITRDFSDNKVVVTLFKTRPRSGCKDIVTVAKAWIFPKVCTSVPTIVLTNYTATRVFLVVFVITIRRDGSSLDIKVSGSVFKCTKVTKLIQPRKFKSHDLL